MAALQVEPMSLPGTLARLLLVVAASIASLFLLTGCDDTTPAKSAAGNEIVKVKIKDSTFKLELVADDATRLKGLGDRTEIKDDEGMLFAFPSSGRLDFVMRDCPIDIDVIFLDSAGRVTAAHAMKAEKPRTEEEKKLDKSGMNEAYENRLARYSSRFSAQFAIELKGGTLEKLKKEGHEIKNGDKIKLDLAELKKKVK